VDRHWLSLSPVFLFPLSIVIAAVILLSGEPAHAQGFIISEIGTRKNTMGAAIGRPDDLSAIYHNPAALALLGGTQITVSFNLAVLRTDIRLAPWPGSDQFMSDSVDSEGYFAKQTPQIVAPMPMIAVSTNLFSKKVVGALGIYVPNAAGASFGDGMPSRYHIIDAYLISAFMTLAVAYRPWPWLAIGLGGSAVYVRTSRRALLYPVINGTNWSGLVGTKTEFTLEGEDVQPAFSLGIQLWPHETLSIGFMMLSRYDVSLEGPFRLKLDPEAPGYSILNKPEITDNQQKTETSAPWVFGFGANWDVTRWLEVGAEFRYYLTSVAKEQRTIFTSGSALSFLLPDGLVTPKNYHDSFHTGGGVNFHPRLPIPLEFMTGMHYESSAAPEKTVDVAAPSFNLASYHVGVRWEISRLLRLALAYSHYWYLERKTTNSITFPPANFIGSGYTNQLSLVLEARFERGIGARK
jgi:long-subunit fatty acid transport protein